LGKLFGNYTKKAHNLSYGLL